VDSVRLFVAIELEDEVRSALAALGAAIGRSCEGVRWIPTEQVHLTVRFLGEVPDGEVNGVAGAVARAATRAEPFTFELADCGCFPPRGPVRIVWAGVREPSGALSGLVEAVNSELEKEGFERERRPFSPHITIGRVREDRSGGRVRAAAGGETFGPVEQPVQIVTLMQSVLSPKGPTYTRISRTSLGSGSALL
jgi:2'-5' RNA ligase